MKVTKEVLDQMKSDIEVVLNFYIGDLNTNFNDLTVANYFTIWSWVWMNRRYSDDNKNVKFKENGERLLEYNPDFEIYPCGTNDATLETALKSILKEILKSN